MKLLIFLITLFSLKGCDNSLVFEQSSSLYDLNGDGIIDITYEKDDSGYFEFVDRNFDGKIDESHYYDRSDIIIFSKIDDDFDGRLETNVFYKEGSVYRVAVDVDNDGLYEIFYFYNFGTLSESLRFYEEDGNKIEKVIFKFGYPEKIETLSDSQVSKSDFSGKYLIHSHKNKK